MDSLFRGTNEIRLKLLRGFTGNWPCQSFAATPALHHQHQIYRQSGPASARSRYPVPIMQIFPTLTLTLPFRGRAAASAEMTQGLMREMSSPFAAATAAWGSIAEDQAYYFRSLQLSVWPY